MTAVIIITVGGAAATTSSMLLLPGFAQTAGSASSYTNNNTTTTPTDNISTLSDSLATNNAITTLDLGKPFLKGNGTIMPIGEPKNGTIQGTYTLDCELSNVVNSSNNSTPSSSSSSSSIGCTDTGSFSLVLIDNRTQYGEGRGALLTEDGETITYTLQFVGNTDNEGRSLYRGSWFPTTSSPRLAAALNNTIALFEAHVEQNGTSTIVGWLWK